MSLGMNLSTAEFLLDLYKKNNLNAPHWYAVLGTGFAAALQEGKVIPGWEKRTEVEFKNIPGMNPATVPGHKGKIVYLENESKQVLALQVGRLHGYEGLHPKQVVQPLYAAYLAGTRNFLLTNSAGGLDPKHPVGALMRISDHFNFTGQNPMAGESFKDFKGQPLHPMFSDMSEVYDRKLGEWMQGQFAREGFYSFSGRYVGVLGPTFETPVEVEIFGKWGLSAVGMSTVWEALALKAFGARVVGFSLISNLACGLFEGKLDHHEILKTTDDVSQRFMRSLLQLMRKKEMYEV